MIIDLLLRKHYQSRIFRTFACSNFKADLNFGPMRVNFKVLLRVRSACFGLQILNSFTHDLPVQLTIRWQSFIICLWCFVGLKQISFLIFPLEMYFILQPFLQTSYFQNITLIILTVFPRWPFSVCIWLCLF